MRKLVLCVHMLYYCYIKLLFYVNMLYSSYISYYYYYYYSILDKYLIVSVLIQISYMYRFFNDFI